MPFRSRCSRSCKPPAPTGGPRRGWPAFPASGEPAATYARPKSGSSITCASGESGRVGWDKAVVVRLSSNGGSHGDSSQVLESPATHQTRIDGPVGWDNAAQRPTAHRGALGGPALVRLWRAH